MPNNIWVAASDGDLIRVRDLVSQHAVSPNAPDENAYTPMHAAASYGHLHVLEYLISQGGDINITDDDGDTPLYTVENVQTAQFLVEHGAIIDRQNAEGITPIDHLSEDFPQVSDYLRSVSSSSTSPRVASATLPSLPSQHSQNVVTEALTSRLMDSVEDIMQRSTAEGWDPEEELRRVVGRTVLEGVVSGYEISTVNESESDRRNGDDAADHDSKRRKTGDDH